MRRPRFVPVLACALGLGLSCASRGAGQSEGEGAAQTGAETEAEAEAEAESEGQTDDFATCPRPCELEAQDCTGGRACVPVECEPGTNMWDGTACVPKPGQQQAGEPCDIFEDPFDGEDDCAAGLVCWRDNWGQQEGTCLPFCTTAGECADPQRVCAGAVTEGFSLCRLVCDPLGAGCPEATDLCAPDPNGEVFTCQHMKIPATIDMGDACNITAICLPGLTCVPSDNLPAGPECGGFNEHCCTRLCELGQANACADASYECVPALGDPSPAYANVGFCALI